MNRLFENGEFYYLVWHGNGRMQASSTNAPGDLSMPARESADELGSARTRGTRRELIHFTSSGRCILTGRSIDAELAGLRRATVLTVGDTGQGIAPEDLPHIFERFFRADKSRSRANSRAGLGLAICKAILDAHGGSIEVTSQPDHGMVFTVRLPTLP